MSTYLFLNGPQSGNVNPTLAIVQGLVEHGNEVIYYLTDDYKEVIESTGATFRSYHSALKNIIGNTPSFMQSNPLSSASSIGKYIVEECQIVIPRVLNDLQGQKPDAIVYGQMALWGRILAQILHVPALLIRPTYASNEHFNILKHMYSFYSDEQQQERAAVFSEADNALKELCKEYHVAPINMSDMMMSAEPLTLVTLPRAFQYAGDTFDERFHFVGPCIRPRYDANDFPLERIQNKPTLYISLGTSFNDRPEFYNICFQAFGNTDWQVVQSIGKRVQREKLDPIPENFIVAPYVPQLEVLKRTDLFVTHGGMNSTMEALSNGIPLVVVPQMGEQMLTAQRIEELGIGIALDPRTLTLPALKNAVNQVAQDPSYRERARYMQQEISRAGGYQAAVKDILNYVNVSTDATDQDAAQQKGRANTQLSNIYRRSA